VEWPRFGGHGWLGGDLLKSAAFVLFLEAGWGEVAEGGVSAVVVVEGLDVVEDLAGELASAGHDWGRMSSFFKVAKNDSATALSKQSPRLPIETAIQRRGPAGRRQETRTGRIQVVVATPDREGLRWAGRLGG